MAYPRPNAVSTRLITAINPSIVNIHSALLSQIPFRVSMYTEGHKSLRRGPTAYHPGSPKEILPYSDRDFNHIHFEVRKIDSSIFQHQINITEEIKRPRNTDFTSFSVYMSAIPVQLRNSIFLNFHCLKNIIYPQFYRFLPSLLSAHSFISVTTVPTN